MARVAAMAAGLIACLPLHYLWRLVGRRSPWPRRFLGWVSRATGMRARVIGRPLAGHVLFVANHLSWLDIPLLAGATGTAFVSKAEVVRWPVIGWLARLNATVFIARTERRSVHGQADALRGALAAGRPVALFPEGTTSDGARLLPFRPSLLAALFPPLTGIKVQSVALDYGSGARALAWVGDEGALANAWRILSRRSPSPVCIRFLDAFDPEALGDRKAVAERCRDEIMRALGASAPDEDRL